MIAALFFTSVAGTGCASYRALSFPDRPPHSFAIRQESHGLTLAAWTLLDEAAVTRYFGDALWDAGYFPVIVHIENEGQQPAVFERGQFTLRLQEEQASVEGEGRDRAPASALDVLVRCERALWPSWLLAPLLVAPAVWAHRSVAQHNFDLTKDFAEKALPSYFRLEPGDPPLVGALFFPRPTSEEPLGEILENAELRAHVKFEGTRLGEETPDDPQATEASRVGFTTTFILGLRDEAQ
ncbi:MAG TPA: hypothetical protein VK116_12910 [Planctomycetota bacterium]|nr:hypothetical protein [Planctomycetota bacterium]